MVSRELLERAATLLRAGRLVAFPTETVYGLGANALDSKAVERIYEVKGRPAASPIIVHTDSAEMARGLVTRWPDSAERLARRFWPGPLTLVLPKHARVPAIVTAGLHTVAVRVPAHPLALELIRAARLPVAAPSANRFSQLSPTTAEHVRQSLGDAVDLILDGGPTTVGIESTVISLAQPQPLLLRPGMISRESLEDMLGPVAVGTLEPGAAHPSPGMHPRHYSPKTPLLLVRHGQLPASGRGAYLRLSMSAPAAKVVDMPAAPPAYAAALYDTLHQLDSERWDWIAVEQPPDVPEWTAILDRLRRAAAE